MSRRKDHRRFDSGYTAFQIVMYISILLSLGVVIYYVVLLMENYKLQEQMIEIENQTDLYQSKYAEARAHGEDFIRLLGSRSEKDYNLSDLDPENIAGTRELATEDYEFLKGKNLTLHQIAMLLDSQLRYNMQVLRRLKVSLQLIEGRVEIQEEKREHVINAYDKRIESLQKRRDTLDGEISKLEGEIDNINTKNEDKVKQLEDRLEDLEQQHSDELTILQNKVHKLEGEIEKLQEREAEVEIIQQPDGEILDSSADNSWAYINLGEDDRVRPGVKFMVYREGKGDIRIRKAFIEVKQVFEDFSRCEVSALASESDPLTKGDKILNPIFSTEMKKRFALAGNFPKGKLHVSREELIRFIEKAQAEVTEKTDVNTDFLITGLGENLEQRENYKLAEEIGIQKMNVQAILQFLGH